MATSYSNIYDKYIYEEFKELVYEDYDLEYIDSGITLKNDIKIIITTVKKVIKKSDIVREGTASDMDFGDWLLMSGKVDKATYDIKMAEAKRLCESAR